MQTGSMSTPDTRWYAQCNLWMSTATGPERRTRSRKYTIWGVESRGFSDKLSATAWDRSVVVVCV